MGRKGFHDFTLASFEAVYHLLWEKPIAVNSQAAKEMVIAAK
jgi:predicted dehydrogenase